MALEPSTNQLLNHLPEGEQLLIQEHLSVFEFSPGQVLNEPGEPIQHIYFPDQGIISAVALTRDGNTVEAYMVGCEGFTGTSAWLVPFKSPVRYLCQVQGQGRRIEATKLRALAHDHLAIRVRLAVYVAQLEAELSQSTACNVLHRADRRFAKWLLRAQDRAGSNVVLMTQEFLGNLLGAQRTTVNEAAQMLAQTGAIRYARGRVQIVDRSALEAASCECYRATKTLTEGGSLDAAFPS